MTYYEKDKEKFKYCDMLITNGVIGSSSYKYIKDTNIAPKAKRNLKIYNKNNIVGVSVNGKRANRMSFNKVLVKAAVTAGAKIVTDNEKNRNRFFNIGERELATFLEDLNCIEYYEDKVRSVWRLAEFLDEDDI